MTELCPSALDDVLRQVEETGWHIDGPQAYCGRCGASAGRGSVTESGCAFCVGKRLPWQRLVRLSAYASPMDQWICTMKFAGCWSWATWLGKLIAEVTPAAVGSDSTDGAADVLVCPVPMHWRRRWWRGYNQAHLLAEQVASVHGWTLAPVLRRSRYTLPQTAMKPSQRHEVSRSITACRVDLNGRRVVLVDDVKTTGSTLAACTRLLKKIGAGKVVVAVAAVADPRHANFKVV